MLTAEQSTFLRDHSTAVLGTGRADGSPQLSTVMYDYDGNDVVVSVKSYTAKWKNVLRQQRVALCVNDGRAQLVVYGHAEAISRDPERVELTRRVFRRIAGREPPAASDLVSVLDAQRRTVLRIRPEAAFLNA